jgi:D-3-phosphoglycerate dehydrogenase / 2-oxoglutarate reductase
MPGKILVSPIFDNDEFASDTRRSGLERLCDLGEVIPYTQQEFTAADAKGVVAVIADSALFTDSFYEAATDLRIVARWGVGFDKVNQEAAAANGVLVTVTPVHMDTVAEYTIAQWMATLKRVYTLNRLSHSGDFSIIRTFEAQGSTLGLYGFGRIGQQVAQRARPLLGDKGRLLVYDVRPDIGEVAARYGAETVDDPMELFRQCDTVSLHVAGDDTIVHYEQLAAMQPHASLINPSRGNLVNDDDAHRAIEEGKLCYYVVDDPVNDTRVVHKDHPRVICTNHNGGITVESVMRLDNKTFEQVTDTLQGRQPDHILNQSALQHPRVRSFLNLDQ